MVLGLGLAGSRILAAASNPPVASDRTASYVGSTERGIVKLGLQGGLAANCSDRYMIGGTGATTDSLPTKYGRPWTRS